jgi:hypothetical protein
MPDHEKSTGKSAASLDTPCLKCGFRISSDQLRCTMRTDGIEALELSVVTAVRNNMLFTNKRPAEFIRLSGANQRTLAGPCLMINNSRCRLGRAKALRHWLTK